MKNLAKPYLDILKDSGYTLMDDDLDTTFDPENPYEEDVYYCYYPTYGKNNSRVELELGVDGLNEVKRFHKSNNNPGTLRLLKIKAYYIDEDCYDGDIEDFESLIFYNVSTRYDDSEIQNIERITPELFRTILKVKESKEAEEEYSHKILQRYLDLYWNIITPIVTPVSKFKGLTFDSSVLKGFDSSECNRNIEINYWTVNWVRKFTIGLDYVTGKLFFYVEPGNPMLDFENEVTTKGRFLELLRNNGI